jgi:hypothetical protein
LFNIFPDQALTFMLKLISKHLACLSLAMVVPVLIPCSPGQADQLRPAIENRNFDRQQLMMMNLTRGHDSTGFYLITSLNKTKDMIRDLEKSINQLDQVEKAYTRSRGRPDDHPLQSSSDRIKQAQQRAGQLELELREAFHDLKSSVTQTLASEGGL